MTTIYIFTLGRLDRYDFTLSREAVAKWLVSYNERVISFYLSLYLPMLIFLFICSCSAIPDCDVDLGRVRCPVMTELITTELLKAARTAVLKALAELFNYSPGRRTEGVGQKYVSVILQEGR